MSLPSTTKRKLTEKQENFLNNLIETKGNLKLSAELAGYSGNHYQVIQSLKQEIVDLASDVLAREAPLAAFKLVEVLQSDKALPQANIKVQAAQTILDRVGLARPQYPYQTNRRHLVCNRHDPAPMSHIEIRAQANAST